MIFLSATIVMDLQLKLKTLITYMFDNACVDLFCKMRIDCKSFYHLN